MIGPGRLPGPCGWGGQSRVGLDDNIALVYRRNTASCIVVFRRIQAGRVADPPVRRVFPWLCRGGENHLGQSEPDAAV